MAAQILATNQPTSDAAVDAAMLTLPPLPDNVAVLVRYLQRQVTALEARVAALETP